MIHDSSFIISFILEDVPDHLSVLGAVDGLILLPNTKHLSIFPHMFYNFQSILHAIKVETSNNIDTDDRPVVCVYLMVNFVLDLSTYAYHQKDSNLVCFVFQLIFNVSLNELNNLLHLLFRTQTMNSCNLHIW